MRAVLGEEVRVLLGNMLLALAWAALQGEFSLGTLVTGHVLGYLILLALVRGGVLARLRTSAESTASSAWRHSSSGSSFAPTCASRSTWPRPAIT